MKQELTQEYLKWCCSYDPDTGEFWRIRRKSWKGNWYECTPKKPAPSVAGYLQINLGEYGVHTVHRLIYLYMTGKLPVGEVDHVDGNRQNNRWENLRQVSLLENSRNRGILKTNTSGYPGVGYLKNKNRWYVTIGIGGVVKTLGTFRNKDDALKVRLSAEIELGYHVNHGRRAAWVK